MQKFMSFNCSHRYAPFLPACSSHRLVHVARGKYSQTIYDSVVILALPLVTLTPSCLARATISILFLEETACAILYACQYSDYFQAPDLWE